MRGGLKEHGLLISGIVVIVFAAAAISYMVASYQWNLRVNEITVIYEYKLESVATQMEKFENNLSTALTYLDIARSEMEKAQYYLDKSIFWMDQERYREMENSTSYTYYHFNKSNFIFSKSLHYFILSQNYTTENYEVILGYYINYTRIGMNLTFYGEKISLCLKNISQYYMDGDTESINQELQKFSSFREEYETLNREMEDTLLKIKTFYGIRD